MDYAKAYAILHEGNNGRWFSGYSIRPYVGEIGNLILDHNERHRGSRDLPPIRLLDYGSGKGFQYLADRVHEAWSGSPLPHCYDPGVRQLRKRPGGTFGGIICTDVMEHIAEADVDAVLADIFRYADERAFAFFAIACRPAKQKRLPDGRNVHLCVRPPVWWETRLAAFRRDGLTIVARYDEG